MATWQEEIIALQDAVDATVSSWFNRVYVEPLANVLLTAITALEAVASFIGQDTVLGWLSDARASVLASVDDQHAEVREQLRSSLNTMMATATEAMDFPLDAEEPFSSESLTAAVNHKLGTNIEDVTDRDSVIEYMKKRAAFEINQALGVDVLTDIESPQEWATLAAALLHDAPARAGFLGEYGCDALNGLLGEFCVSQQCHGCMDDEERCRERRRKDRERNEGRRCKRK